MQGYMNWMHIPSSESCYNITVSDHMKIYQFAISANSQSSLKTTGITSLYQPTSISSGMVWASCTVLHNKSMNIVQIILFAEFLICRFQYCIINCFFMISRWKKENVQLNGISSTSMELRWKLECFDRIRRSSRISFILLSHTIHK